MEQHERPERQYRVYYARFSPYVGQGSQWLVDAYAQGSRWTTPSEIPVDPPALFTIAGLPETHVCVWELTAPSLDAVYHRMQVDGWDQTTWAIIDARLVPNMHTSMSDGDVVEDVAAGQFFECELRGWRQLE